MSIERIVLVPDSIEIVSSIDELNYQDVLNDFPNAEFIFVTIYNISARRDYLLELLKEATEYAEVRIVTNIPNHFDGYYNEAARQRARDSINNYTERLNPDEEEGLSTFYNFNNHTKIVLTNNIAYIGSANFSDESARNRETGTLIRDPEKVQLIIDNLVPLIEDEGIQYFGDILNQKQILLSKLLSDMISVADNLKEGLYTYVGRFEEEEIYNSRDPFVSKGKLNQLYGILSEFDEEVRELINTTGLTNISDLINMSYFESACFNHQDYTSNLISDEFSYYDELDEATDIATQRAFDRQEELAEAAEAEVTELFNLLDSIEEGVTVVINHLEALYERQQVIDNT